MLNTFTEKQFKKTVKEQCLSNSLSCHVKILKSFYLLHLIWEKNSEGTLIVLEIVWIKLGYLH